MMLCVTSTGPDLDSQVDPRFGRCRYFIFVDTKTQEYEVFDNNAADATGGAGRQAARSVAEKGASAVLTGKLGPNAVKALMATGLKMLTGVRGISVKQAVENYRNGLYSETNSASVDSHYGMASAPNPPAGQGMSQVSAEGAGRGAGRVIGMGRGIGQGMRPGRRMGRGAGRGICRSTGMNADVGMAAGAAHVTGPAREEGFQAMPGTSNSGNEIESLKEQARLMREQLADIQKRINELSMEDTATRDYQVAVEEAACTGCGICADVCPTGAIAVNDVAEINPELCTGCGICIDNCPAGALHIIRR